MIDKLSIKVSHTVSVNLSFDNISRLLGNIIIANIGF